MDLLKVIADIEKLDADAADRLAFYSRRNLFRFGQKAVASALPAVFAMTAQQAFAQAPSQAAVDVLNYALTLEYLEDEYYRLALNTANLIPATDRTVMMQISKHEAAHVALLRTALGTAAVAKPTFKFGNSFADYQTFLGLAQALEDTGVRAYKGQAGALINDKGILTVALQIHSVEARHAAQVRRMRAQRGWITSADTAPAPVYAGENVTTQGGVDLVALTGKSADAVAAAFDEPLTKAAVLAIAGNYIA
jgi:hypothetical protein